MSNTIISEMPLFCESHEDLYAIISELKAENETLKQKISDNDKRHSDWATINYAINTVRENIIAADMDGKILFANKQFMDEHGLSDYTDRYLYNSSFGIRGLDAWRYTLRTIERNQGYLNFTHKVLNRNQQKVYYEVFAYKVEKGDGDCVIWLFARDTTDKVLQSKKVRELNHVMDMIFNAIPMYLFVKDTENDFKYMYWNRTFEEQSGIPASKAIGRTDFDIFPDIEDAKRFRRDDIELSRSGESRLDYYEEYTSVDGVVKQVKTSKLLVPMEDRKPLILGVTWDITELSCSERELIAAKTEAERSNRLKSAFIANMSHEIRTPLNAIIGFSKLITTTDDDAEKQQYSEIVDSNTELLLRLIDDILDISQIETGAIRFIERQMNLSEMCRNIYDTHCGKTQRGVRLVYDGEYEHVDIINDSNRLTQAITCLITNAIKFTSNGEIHYGFKVDGDRIVFHVKDTGMGISADNLDMIFMIFIKLNSFIQGSGLGLSIAKMIIERMGGAISVVSEVGVGTEFTFSIPYKPVV